MSKTFLIIFQVFSLYILNLTTIIPQQPIINKIEPPNWWANHTYNNVQLMVYGEELDSLQININTNKIKIEKVTLPSNNNYLFVDLKIENDAEPKDYTFSFSNKFGKTDFTYSLIERDTSQNIHQGFSNEDVVYLIFPDRFVNGDQSNDFLFNDKEEFEFGSLNGRHGGDIQGMINSLDYLKDLGITAIWSTPLLENNMYMSYHGYAATDLYRIDPRQGSNELYKKFVSESHKKGIKVIYDHVANHIGINHEWVKNRPNETWFNGKVEDHKSANHDKVAIFDIYGSDKTIEASTEGWFNGYMPDLNQADPYVAKYIIQNTIWWIEYSGIDGIREDTYPYADQKFMAEWAATILEHYPNFNIVGEVWKGLPSVLAAYQTNSYFPEEFDSNLPVVTDFALRDALFEYLTGHANFNRIYETFAQDFIYSKPNNLLVFFDNHDIDRGMYGAKWNMHKFKAALTLVLTTRGIPQLFYGTEFGLDGGGHHGKIREMFPVSFLYPDENTIQVEKKIKQKNIYNFSRDLLHLRKNYKSLSIGKLTHFPPKENTYIYTKTLDDEKILICINDNENNVKIDLHDYFSSIDLFTNVKDLLKNSYVEVSQNSDLIISAQSISIYLIVRE